MSKTVSSPVKSFPGSVVLADPLTHPQLVAFQRAHRAVQEAGEDIVWAEQRLLLLPGLLACVERWELQGIPENPTPDTFPASPERAVARLLAWLIEEITHVWVGDPEDDPNG